MGAAWFVPYLFKMLMKARSSNKLLIESALLGKSLQHYCFKSKEKATTLEPYMQVDTVPFLGSVMDLL
jgi:hypothetical protein